MALSSEKERVRQLDLDTYDIQQLGSTGTFDSVLTLATEISGAASAAINVISGAEQINIAMRNCELPVRTPREISFCNIVVDKEAAFEVEDATTDPRFSKNPYVNGSDGFRFYAGHPVKSSQGFSLGTLCIFDTVARRLTDSQRAQLSELALITQGLLEAHRAEYQRQRIAAIMRVQSEVLQQASLANALKDMADKLIHGTESCIAKARASMSIVTEDKKRLLWIAGPSLPKDFAQLCSNVDIESTDALCALVAQRRGVIMCPDITRDEELIELRPTLEAFGIRSFWSCPLFASGGALIGTFSLFFSHARELTDADCALFEIVGETASILVERDRSLRSLIESERQLSEAQKIAGLGAYTAYMDSGLRVGSAITNQILGLPPDFPSMTTAQYDALIYSDDVEQVAQDRAEAIKQGCPLRTNYRIVRRSDGAVRWISGYGIPIQDIDGRITRYTGVMQDITDQRKAESTLRLYQRAIESSSNGVVIVDALDPKLPVVYVNPAFVKLTGYNLPEVLGKNLRFLQGSQRDQASRREIRDALERESEVRAVFQNFSKSGAEYWIELSVAPVRDEKGIVSHFVGFQTDITDRIRYEKELTFQAAHDSLTGLANRSLLNDRIDQGLIRNQGGNRLAVVFIDLDRFKLVNDSLGHAAGDRLLKEAARRIQRLIKESDTVARMGGDEFVIFFSNITDQEAAQRHTQEILNTLDLPFSIDGHSVTISASAGIAVYPEHGNTTSQLLRNADIAMYEAKSNGRSNSKIFSNALSATAVEKLGLKEALQTALVGRQFCLHYQPKINTNTGELVGFEALVRWNEPSRGLLYPASFIDAMEEFNLISALGTWVLQEACRQTMAWHLSGQYEVSVAVNVSASQFRKSSFFDEVVRALKASGLQARYLELEITESLMMESPEQFIQILGQLHQIGVKISVDDFGTGYSSLSFIRQFPIDYLKIDKSFVQDINTDSSDAAICATNITMAHNLGLMVVAEGVETVGQATFLKANGCDILQGYLISKPLPPEAPFGPFPLCLRY
jgi:diguanylate cyclase (GGDEF)-like protein/PAS domain S-box-containing protein